MSAPHCRLCRVEIDEYAFTPECELCRTCLVLGHEFLARDFDSLLTEYAEVDRLAWKIGEYMWTYKDRKYEDSVLQRKKLMHEVDRVDRHRRLVGLLSEADEIKMTDVRPEGKVRSFYNIFEDMAKILREEYPDERTNEDRAAPED